MSNNIISKATNQSKKKKLVLKHYENQKLLLAAPVIIFQFFSFSNMFKLCAITKTFSQCIGQSRICLHELVFHFCCESENMLTLGTRLNINKNIININTKY